MRKLPSTGPSSGNGSTGYSTFARCQQKWAYERYGYVGRHGNAAQNLGIAVHFGVAAYYLQVRNVQTGRDPYEYETAIDAMDRGWAEGLIPHVSDDDKKRAYEAATSVIQRDWNETKWEILAVEQVFELELGELPEEVWPDDPPEGWSPVVSYAPTVDLVARNKRNGKVYMIDHKTSASDTPKSVIEKRKRWTMALQMQGMEHLGRLYYPEDWGGVRIQLIKSRPRYGASMIELMPNPVGIGAWPTRLYNLAVERAKRELEISRGDLSVFSLPANVGGDQCFPKWAPGVCSCFDLCTFGPG